jgi:hypothetical protein
VNAKVLFLPFVLLTACSGPRGCSAPVNRASESPPSTQESTPIAVPDVLAGRRAQLVTRIDGLTDDECDALVLRFQLIPRDEVLEPMSKPRKELLRYVKLIASDGELDDLDRAISERKKWPRQ